MSQTPNVPLFFVDPRPQKGGWAPGNYGNTCYACGQSFVGDKRAICCADCAYDEAPPPSVLPTDEEVAEYLTVNLNRGKHGAMTPVRSFNIIRLLAEGNDPFLLAVHYRVDFTAVAKLAEAHLVKTLGDCPQPEKDLNVTVKPGETPEDAAKRADEANQVATYIPHTLQDYLFFAAALEKDAQTERKAELGFLGRAAASIRKLGQALKEGAKNL